MADDPLPPPAPRRDGAVTIVNTLSLTIVCAYIGMMPLWMIFPPKVQPEVLAILNQMMGAWGYAFAAVIGYHLGSTKGAREAQADNREAMKTLATTAANTAAAAATVAAVVPIPPPPPDPNAPPANGTLPGNNTPPKA